MSPSTASPLSHSPTATILVLSAVEEIARAIEAQMRNSGFPVRAAWLSDLEEFEDLLHRSPPDLVLCATDLANVPAADVVRLCARFAPDLPAVFLSPGRASPEEIVSALEAGARDVAAAADNSQLAHLEQVCLRELRNHYLRRDLRNMRARLADFESRHHKLLAGTADAVVHVQEGIITHCNAAFAALLGHPAPESLHGNPLMDFVANSGQSTVKAFLKQVSQGKLPTEAKIDLLLQSSSGDPIKCAAHATLGDSQGERLLELLIRAPAAIAAPAPAATPPSAVPAPSGRTGLMQILQSAIKANVGMHRALTVIMVDSFASIEQRMGYQESEEVLDQIGALVQQRLSGKEPMFRFSTALYASVISRPHPEEFAKLSETLREDVAAQLFKTLGHETHVSVTVVSHPLSQNDQAAGVVDAAVGEVRARSREGGNRTAVIGKTAEAVQIAMQDQRRSEQLKKALDDNRLKLAYQSIASLEGDDRQHFDVLVRMLDESGHEVPAREFIPAAERHGLIVAVDRWVVNRALGVLSKRQGTGDQSSLFVRISEQTLREGDQFYKWFLEQTRIRKFAKHQLVIAIPENVVETHISKGKALCTALREAGADVALDHFGVGSKSAQLLDLIPAEFVRFDYAFSKDFDDPALQSKLSVLMTAAKKKGVKTIMGQVENASAMARLWQLGVNYIQGFHIQAPEAVQMSADVRR